MTGLCKDCKWLEYDGFADWYKCSLSETINGGKVYESSKARALDGEAEHGRLIVDPDFGCVQFEAKDVTL